DNALKLKLVKPEQLSRINVDTTVSQNNTAFPTDARLYNRAIQLLVKDSRRDNLTSTSANEPSSRANATRMPAK
ncbi:MAG: IS5/IS1182 family transposase, partial [Akkermansia sp.]